MEISVALKLSTQEVFNLLDHFDDSSNIPLHCGLDFNSYSKKLSVNALFVIAKENAAKVGFIAYYLNEEGHFAYIPQIVVHKKFRHMGVGHSMLVKFVDSLPYEYDSIKLEVLKSNTYAISFYKREGFFELEDHNERLLLKKDLK